MLFIAIVGLLMEIAFGTLPLWPGISSFDQGYTFQNKQFYYTFIVLGIFGCMLGAAGAIMDHKFILIGTIWLCSFTAASYIIKLSWELISLLIAYTQSFDKDDFDVAYWPMLVKYAMSIIFYSILTFVAYRACDEIFNNFMIKSGFDPEEQLSQAYIDSVYARISNTMGSRTLNAKLLQHRNQLHSLLYQASLSSRSNTTQQGIEMQAAHNWDTTSTFQHVPNGQQRAQPLNLHPQPGVPQRTQSHQQPNNMSSTNENTYLMVNRSLPPNAMQPPPVPFKPGSVKQN